MKRQTILWRAESQRVDGQIRIVDGIAINENSASHALSSVVQKIKGKENCVCGVSQKKRPIKSADFWIVDALQYFANSFNQNAIVNHGGFVVVIHLKVTKRIILGAFFPCMAASISFVINQWWRWFSDNSVTRMCQLFYNFISLRRTLWRSGWSPDDVAANKRRYNSIREISILWN